MERTESPRDVEFFAELQMLSDVAVSELKNDVLNDSDRARRVDGNRSIVDGKDDSVEPPVLASGKNVALKVVGGSQRKQHSGGVLLLQRAGIVQCFQERLPSIDVLHDVRFREMPARCLGSSRHMLYDPPPIVER